MLYRNFRKKFLIFAFLITVALVNIFLFQNCSPGYDVKSVEIEDDSDSSCVENCNTTDLVFEDEEKPSTTTTTTNPILITFDLHMDQLSSNSYTEKMNTFSTWIDNTNWLLDTFTDSTGKTNGYGVKISFLSAGMFFEACQSSKLKETCYKLIQNLYASGGMIGSHSHYEYRKGEELNWLDIDRTKEHDDDVEKVWNDNQTYAYKVIIGALGKTLGISSDAQTYAAESTFSVSDFASASKYSDDYNEVKSVNSMRGSHTPSDRKEWFDLNNNNTKYQYSMIEGGGGEQELNNFFGHTPFTIFRPSSTCGTCEDTTGSLITFPQAQIPGDVGQHGAGTNRAIQNGKFERKQVELLQILVNKRISEALNEPKIWTYGWALHGDNIDEKDTARTEITNLIGWIKTELVDNKNYAKFSSYSDAKLTFENWEKSKTSTSSFNFDTTSTTTNSSSSGTAPDYTNYPYAKWVNQYLRKARFIEKIETDKKIDAYKLAVQDWGCPDDTGSPYTGSSYDLVLITRVDKAVKNFKLSGIFGKDSSLYKIGGLSKDDGASTTIAKKNINKIPLTKGTPVIFCKSEECSKILKLDVNKSGESCDGN